MAQGQLGLYGPRPAEIRPAALCVKARVYDLVAGRVVARGASTRTTRGARRSGPPVDWAREPSIRESAECSLIGRRRTAAECDRTSHMSGAYGMDGLITRLQD